MKKNLIKVILGADIFLLIFAGLNLNLLLQRADLPKEYKASINSFTFDVNNIHTGRKILEFDGKPITKVGLLDFYLLHHKKYDTVKIKSEFNEQIIETSIVLPPKYSWIDLTILVLVALFYFFTGIYILLKFRYTAFAYVIHMVTIFTGVMIIFDWGDILTYNKIIHFFLFLLFEFGIFLVPTLFLHFGFTYPESKSKFKFVLLVPFYFASAAFMIISLFNLISIFFMGNDVKQTYFIEFHTYVADLFLIIGLILTIAKLENSALTINDRVYRKKIYWALLGISFGPLIYVFMMLMPRLILGYELVSELLMQFTIIIAPIMLLVSVSLKKQNNSEWNSGNKLMSSAS
ncbi:MAG: hypothetical protein ABFS12_12355 [Bacteroidota bacterium]